MPVNDEPTPYEKELRRAMTAVETIANDTGPAVPRLAALERHARFVDALRGRVYASLTHADWHPGETDDSLAEAIDQLQRRCP